MQAFFAIGKRLYSNGNRLTVALIPGDGIGPEIAVAVQKVFAAANVPVDWEEVNVSPVITATGKTAIPESSLSVIKQCRYGLKGPLATPIGRGHVSLNLTLRRALNLYANVRPCRSITGYRTLYDKVDTVVIRENTEGEYSGIEHEVVRGVVQSVKLITREASERIARYAFKYATDSGRNHVTIVHKATIMYTVVPLSVTDTGAIGGRRTGCFWRRRTKLQSNFRGCSMKTVL